MNKTSLAILKPQNSTVNLESRFQWKSNGGQSYYPEEMETKYLFHVLRMIWNHSAPENRRLKPYKHYIFGPFYTKQYMIEAVRELSTALLKRKDLTLEMTKDLERMKSGHRRLPAG